MKTSSVLFIASLLLNVSSLAIGPADPPDFTKGERKGVDLKQQGTYNLGSTGMRGWIYCKAANNLDAGQGRSTLASRQILVTHVGPGSPADGVMAVDDVILGVGGKPFADDARKSLAWAIQEAEKETNGGVLKLTRWRAGKTDEVELKLRVMGTYSATAPYNCPKSKRILGEAIEQLEKESLSDDLWGAIRGLALLSTGRDDCLPKLQEFARRIGPKDLSLELKPGMVVWQWGYKNVFLCEYFLRTGDKEVFPAIQEFTTKLAMGQSLYGTFGHGLSGLREDGGLHGSIPPYGPVNAAGLVGNLAIVMGAKCGVKHPEVAPAIDRAAKFFGYFADKGSIPYGEHVPWIYHGSNGKTAQTAVLFAMMGDQLEKTRFFAKMSTAAHANLEYGHTGQGFSYLWSMLGANVGGPESAAAYFREISWRCDLARRCDGSFTYDGAEQYGAGRTKDDTYFGEPVGYGGGLSPNATYVLAYALPLKQLHIAGKSADQANWLSRDEAADAAACGKFDLARKQQSPAQLVAAFSSWSPIVRAWAAEELASRPEAKAMVPEWIQLARGKDVHVAQGAVETLGFLRAAEALPVLVDLLKHDDHWLRYKAAEAIDKMGDKAKPVTGDLLKAIVDTATPVDSIEWADPIQFSHGQLAKVLFRGLLRDSLEGVDRNTLYPAIRAIALNPDGRARGHLGRTFEQLLSLEDVEALAPVLLQSITVQAPADTMFRDEIRMGAFRALTRNHYEEGIAAGVIYAKTQGNHGSENRTPEIMKEIVSYGAAAKPAIPGLRELIQQFKDDVARGEYPERLNSKRIDPVEAAIQTIEAATEQPELRRIAGK